MTSRTKLVIAVAALTIVIVGISLARLMGQMSMRERAHGYTAIAGMYSHELQQGVSRAAVNEYIIAHGGKPESDSQPNSSRSDDILVQLGQEPSPWYCSRHVVYLRIEFDAADKYRITTLKPELQDCL